MARDTVHRVVRNEHGIQKSNSFHIRVLMNNLIDNTTT